ncbi:MAG: hypothetical protein K2X77_16895 [Candidatus Obscuribacterales bacterium]|jgi:hypothetical protein|nr:hypothetical protein [Candidatus Obscuribacterales bacterium]
MNVTVFEINGEIESDELDDLVLSNYRRIYAQPPEESRASLDEYYASLEESCTMDSPCIECIGDRRNFELERLYDQLRCQKSLLRLKRGRWIS